jgi:hypothetical protein
MKAVSRCLGFREEKIASNHPRVAKGASAPAQVNAAVTSHSFVKVPAQQRHAMIAEVVYGRLKNRWAGSTVDADC